jgi:hypothetical protein
MSDVRDVPIDLDDDSRPEPRTPATFSGDQFDRLIDAIKGNQAGRIEAEAEIHALAMRKQLSPQNEVSPQISVFNPFGERDHPRPPLQCEFFLGPYPLEAQTLLMKEIEYLNKLVPGSFEVTKSDGSTVPFHVIPKFRLDGRTVERLTIAFPCADDDQRQNFPPFAQMLREVVDQIEVARLTAAV